MDFKAATIVAEYVRESRLRHKEVFVPLAHPAGQWTSRLWAKLWSRSPVGSKLHISFDWICEHKLRGHEETIASRFERHLEQLLGGSKESPCCRAASLRTQGTGQFYPEIRLSIS